MLQEEKGKEEKDKKKKKKKNWFGWVLWHINHCRLFNAKSFLYIYIKYI